MEQTVSKTNPLGTESVGRLMVRFVVVSNMLLDKYQIGTKKSEFQKLLQTI